MKMSLVLFSFIVFIHLISGCNDPMLEKNALNAVDPTDQGLKSQPVEEKLFHPRILLKDSVLNVLKEQYKTDAMLQKCVNKVMSNADSYLNTPKIVYSLDSENSLLTVGRTFYERTYHLVFAYRWTGDTKYAAAAKNNLLDVAKFPDWHPSTILNVGELMASVGRCYDWIYNYLDPTSRSTIEYAIINYGLKPYLEENLKSNAAIKKAFNFNLVVNGGAIISALAIADVDPDLSQKAIQTAVSNFPVALKSYAPDGAWPEGFNYWTYATNYAMYGISALQVALGTDFGLSKTYGFSNACNSPIYAESPTGKTLYFSDGYLTQRGDQAHASFFWFGKQYNDPMLINEVHRRLEKSWVELDHVIYYQPKPQKSVVKNLDKFLDGNSPYAVFRSSWDDVNALFLGAKAGYNLIDHGHLDLGNYELEALGVRWAADLGRDSYSLAGYWENWQGGRRWTYYRCNSHSHNVPMINNKDQLVSGKAVVIAHAENVAEPFIKFDLTSAYSDDTKSVVRELRLINNRKAAQITDIFNLKSQADIYWGMTTPATIQILANGEALLTKDGKQLTAKILSPSGLNFYSESCTQPSPQNANAGYTRLMVKTNRPAGEITLKIMLTPKY